MTPPFGRVLVANRGEIAIRVMRTLRELDIASIAIYSDADRDAEHVAYADEAWCIGGELPAASYLRIDAVVDVARRAGAEAIHPGYGFLAENAAFARACAAAGIVFVGPSPKAIEQMGSKTAARELMQRAGVPVVPGSVEPLTDVGRARAVADEVGYPVAVKARSGGGGKGFRVARTADELAAAFEGAAREGDRFFDDAAVYVERYLHDPRHVEVQLLADAHGAVVHLGERDCTVQRRHQKLIEEAPAPPPFGTDELRERLGAMAVDAARAVDYCGAGTIECLLDADGTPYFLEMNTRVQVEHTVTELLTGIDIVAEQLHIAAGRPLRLAQSDVVWNGHAIECRINAEDARADFRPSSGLVTRWREPGGPGVRVDAGFRAGSVVPTAYDTLLAKLVVHAHDRDAAIARMLRALGEFEIEGVDTLIEFHRALIGSEEFRGAGSCRSIVDDPAAHLPGGEESSGARTPSERPGARAVEPRTITAEVDGRRFDVRLYDPASGRPLPPAVRPRTAAGAAGGGQIVAPIPGNVVQVLVGAGQQIAAGDVVCILEAMKMENEIAAPRAGVVREVSVEAGASVAAGQLLASVTVADGE